MISEVSAPQETAFCIDCANFIPWSDGKAPYITESSETIHRCRMAICVSVVDGKTQVLREGYRSMYCAARRRCREDQCGPAALQFVRREGALA